MGGEPAGRPTVGGNAARRLAAPCGGARIPGCTPLKGHRESPLPTAKRALAAVQARSR